MGIRQCYLNNRFEVKSHSPTKPSDKLNQATGNTPHLTQPYVSDEISIIENNLTAQGSSLYENREYLVEPWVVEMIPATPIVYVYFPRFILSSLSRLKFLKR